MKTKTIPFISLASQHARIRTEALAAMANVYDKNWFVLGQELDAFEREYATFSNSPYCIGVGNGLDALFIALKASEVGAGDEVIVPAHTFIATWLSVVRTGAKVVPVEPDTLTFNIDVRKLPSAIGKHTKAIIPVHLYGQACEMTEIISIGRQRSIHIIEDNAQAHGATWDGKTTGSLGDCSATSFYPVKNLGALGDGGAIITQTYEVARRAAQIRNYGFEEKNIAVELGINSRLDEIQAAFLRIKLRHVETWNNERIKLAREYLQHLEGIGDVVLPASHAQARHVYHLFVIRTAKRNALRRHLSERGIETAIHYPVPPHLQKSLKDLGFKKGDFPIAEEIAETALSLPLWPGLELTDLEYICDVIKKFFA